MVDNNTVIEGSVKFRDGKKWKSRWCVMRKLSPVADCLHLQLYRDSRDRYKQGQTKASLSLQHFLGVETGFTLDKESNTIAIICQDVTVVLAFDTRERLIQWQVKIACNLGEGVQFLVLVSQAPSKAKISTGPARLHVQELRFCMTSGVPPRLIGCWEIGNLRRYGVVEGRFCFEGGSRCGKGEGLYVLVTDQGGEITRTLQMAAQGKLASRRRQVVRKSSVMDSPRKLLHSRQENRVSDVLNDGHTDSLFDSESHTGNQSEHRSGSPYWSMESRHTDLDSNYGCGDTASVHIHADNAWPNPDGRGVPTSLERCVSCISKLGAPSMSRSSTANTSTLFSPAWTMEPVPTCQHQNPMWGPGSDRISVSSHGTGSSGSGNSEYSVPRHICPEKVSAPPCPPLPPKTPAAQQSQQQQHQQQQLQQPQLPPLPQPQPLLTEPRPSLPPCQCCPPSRPPKPSKEASSASPSRKKIKKPPMPLPQEPSCGCSGPYENYDVPRNLLPVKEVYDKQPLTDPSNRLSMSPTPSDYYDTPKNIKENLSSDAANYSNYDTPPPAKTIRKPCGCIVTFARQAVDSEPRAECPCQRVLCWAENWMILPYCRRGHGIENTSIPIHKVRLSGEGKMPVVNASGEIAIYATVDKSKKSKKPEDEPHTETNYVNVDPTNEDLCKGDGELTNYENIDFAQSLEYYENSKDLLQKAGISKEEFENLTRDINKDSEVCYVVNNGVKVCNKCGHACESNNDKDNPPGESPVKQEDYLMMEPSEGSNQNLDRQINKSNPNFPGYLPMFPSNKTEVLKLLASRGLPVEKSASISSLPSCGQRGRKRSENEMRVPGSAMMVMPSSANPFVRRLINNEEERRKQITSRKRSSSADSSRYLEEYEDVESRASSLSSPFKTCSSPTEKPTSNSLTSLPYQSPKKIESEPVELPEQAKDLSHCDVAEEEYCEKTIVEDLNGGDKDEDCSSSGSLQTLVHEGLADTSPGTVYIRRSSSVPCKSGNNRDSSSSNDSGVSTGSLKHRGGDFTEFELPLTTSMSTRRHQSVTQRHPGITCLHASLPRRSKSSDPLRELSFQFQMTKIPAKSSSAEAEVPICPSKKGYFSPGDGITVPYMDSRSTSSGTSDMSDYIETLSLSSHSSSDAPESLHRITRIAATTLRPRSGNEYHKIDRSILNGDLVVKNQRGHYANIAPLPEKSESPSPGYMSSSPAHEVQCNEF